MLPLHCPRQNLLHRLLPEVEPQPRHPSAQCQQVVSTQLKVLDPDVLMGLDELPRAEDRRPPGLIAKAGVVSHSCGQQEVSTDLEGPRTIWIGSVHCEHPGPLLR